MRNNKFVFLTLIFSFITFTCTSCDETTSSNKVDEYSVLLEYLEGDGGDFINTAAPTIKSAEAVRTDMTSGTQHIIDIRSAESFAQGHIQNAVNVAFVDLLTHMEGLSSNPTSVVIVCYSGQTAAYGAALLRLAGYNNVYSMKFGMSSWHSDFDVWSAKLANNYVIDFETTANPKGEATEAPKLDTGKKEPMDILKDRVETLLVSGFSEASISAATVVPNSDNYYIVNYWPETQYLNPGHIAGAYCYVPKTDLKSTTSLNTLPADETIVIYCYTGQTSAYVTAFLKILGYDAKSLMFGANNMIYDTMPAGKYVAETEVKNYEYITGN